MRKFLFFLFILIGLWSCEDNNEIVQSSHVTEPDYIEYEIEYSYIHQGDGGADVSGGNYVINDNEAWVSIIDQLGWSGNVDFEDYTVIAVFDLEDTNNHIGIEYLQEIEGSIVVKLKYWNLSNPIFGRYYEIIKIPKTEMPIVFEY